MNQNQFPDCATALTARIEAFDKYICSLPGRVYTVIEVDGVKLEIGRSGTKWALTVEIDGPKSRLIDASLKIKMACIPLLPQLLAQMDTNQRQMINGLTQACESFDKLFPDIKVNDEPESNGNY